MASFVYKYKCDKTGKTYPVEKLGKATTTSSDISTVKLEAPCQDCGGKHLLFVEESK